MHSHSIKKCIIPFHKEMFQSCCNYDFLSQGVDLVYPSLIENFVSLLSLPNKNADKRHTEKSDSDGEENDEIQYSTDALHNLIKEVKQVDSDVVLLASLFRKPT